MFPIIDLGFGLSLPTYFVVLSLVTSIIVLLTVKRADRLSLFRNDALDILMIGLITGTIGARLFHVIWEAPDYYLENPLHVLFLWQGGFVFYGGLITGYLGCLLLIRHRLLNSLVWADFFAPLISLGYALGRFACLFAGCCFGKTCDLPWGVRVPTLGDAVDVLRHPTPLYSTLWDLGIFAILMGLESWKLSKPKPKNFLGYLIAEKGSLLFIWAILHGIGRIIIESFRDDFRGFSPMGYSISTWLSFALLAFGLVGFTRLARSILKNL